MIIAVIDIGTNTTRLLVKNSETNEELTREVVITRLGEGLEKTGSLSDEAMERTRRQVVTFVDKAKSLGAEKVDVFATAGSRASSNGAGFIDSLNNIDSVQARIIDGETEAQFSFNGAISGFQFDETKKADTLPLVVVDIGGGSTELAISTLGDETKCESFVSIPIGSVRLTERYLHSDPPLPEELTNAIGDVRDSIADALVENPIFTKAKSWIGVAATLTTTAAVEIGLKEYDKNKLHGFILTKEMAEDVFRTLATEDIETRKHNPGLDPERAGVIVGGLCIIVAIMRHFELAQITISCCDLLDGLYLSMCSL